MSFSHTVNADQATFLGFGLEGVAYGIHVLLFGSAVTLLTRSNFPKGTSMRPIFAVSCLLFCMSTVHHAINFNNVYTSTMVHPRPHIADETHLLVGADTIFILSDFFSQLVLIYRCYLVWNKNIWIVILPILVAFAAASCGISVIALVLSVAPTAPQAPADIVPFGDASFAMSLILNFSSSTLIVARLWWLSRVHSVPGISRARRILRQATGVIIESGLLFLATQFVFVVLFAIAHPAQALVEPMAVQIYAISPLLIVVRIGMGKSYEQTVTIDSSVPARNAATSLRFVSFNKKTKTTSSTLGNSTQDVELDPYKSYITKETVVEAV
ncbi:hypothetical protein MSAN_01327500 [Mycena sanguinolenta]|uniref:Uncharacterized protein n=1 Tax=Mycena sanguinolenta TaxID=230812 RepID=A0A8H6YFH3_9AGAR|nr:hypothetical protein MSAN_01327500 [Mycena sanguinolenta]